MFKLRLFNFRKNSADSVKSEKKEDNAPDGSKKMSMGFFGIFRKRGPKPGTIEYFKKKSIKKEEKRATIQERRHRLAHYLERSGMSIKPEMLSKILFNFCVGVNLVISAFFIYHFSTTLGVTWSTILAWIVSLWLLVFAVLLFVMWIMFYVFVDLRVFKRKVDIEEVLPDYLQLTASNIKSGMSIDRALWYAVRPRFGVLAKEIEMVAKETMRGEDLKSALQKFANKYDSVLLKRTISLLIEGLDAGGKIGDLLNKIAVNIQENKIMRREMSANITTYAIFITFTTVAAAPVLFALAGTLIQVIASLGSTVGQTTTSGSGLGMAFSSSSIDYRDFKIFAIVALIINSFFSATILSIIKKGNAKSGFKYIPIFTVITITLFLIASGLFNKLLGIFF